MVRIDLGDLEGVDDATSPREKRLERTHGPPLVPAQTSPLPTTTSPPQRQLPTEGGTDRRNLIVDSL